MVSLISESRSKSEKRKLALDYGFLSLPEAKFSWCSVFIFHFRNGWPVVFHFSEWLVSFSAPFHFWRQRLLPFLCPFSFFTVFHFFHCSEWLVVKTGACSLSLRLFIFHFSEWLEVKTGVFFTFFTFFYSFFTFFHCRFWRVFSGFKILRFEDRK